MLATITKTVYEMNWKCVVNSPVQKSALKGLLLIRWLRLCSSLIGSPYLTGEMVCRDRVFVTSFL